jgi:hypothetical protein
MCQPEPGAAAAYVWRYLKHAHSLEDVVAALSRTTGAHPPGPSSFQDGGSAREQRRDRTARERPKPAVAAQFPTHGPGQTRIPKPTGDGLQVGNASACGTHRILGASWRRSPGSCIRPGRTSWDGPGRPGAVESVIDRGPAPEGGAGPWRTTNRTTRRWARPTGPSRAGLPGRRRAGQDAAGRVGFPPPPPGPGPGYHAAGGLPSGP